LETNKEKAMKVPVLVVGGGPVGLCVAGDLGWRGIDVLEIERTDGAVVQPKMDMPHIRTLEFCRRWGLVEQVEQSGYNRKYPQDNVWVTSLIGGHELGREPFPCCDDEPYPPQSPQRRERAPQNFFDPVIARWTKSFPSVDLRYFTELVDFTESDDGVRATIRDTKTGATEEVEARYMVACDGAGSMIREKLGITLTGNAVLTYTTNVIFRSRDLDKLKTIKTGYRYIFIGPEGTWATLVAIDGYENFRFSLVGGASRSQMSDDDLIAAIKRAVGAPCDIELVSTMPWTRRELVADKYGTKRIFLVGDSAHQLSPTGAFGMNTGLQEAVDIAWKLEAMVRGWGGPNLMASYESERKPVAAINVRTAAENLGRMLETRTRKPPMEIFETGAKADAARKEYGDWYTKQMWPEWFTIGIHIGYRYDKSPIVVGDGTSPPPFDMHTYIQTSHAGCRAPHAWMKDGRSTLDLFGKGFVLMRLGANPPDASALLAAAKSRGVPIREERIDEAAVTSVYEKTLVLVRPDGHVAWRGDDLPEIVLGLVDKVRGA
jgi:2-polyprenyl-6-methoxyphenol hydroxylase-like FAD-dependent oxidoreductase